MCKDGILPPRVVQSHGLHSATLSRWAVDFFVCPTVKAVCRARRMAANLRALTHRCCYCCECSAAACHDAVLGVLIVWLVWSTCRDSGTAPTPRCDPPSPANVAAAATEATDDTPCVIERV